MSKPTQTALAKRIRKQLVRIIHGCREQIATAEYWAANRPECEPLDCEPSRVTLHFATQALAAWDRGDTHEAGRLLNQLDERIRSPP